MGCRQARPDTPRAAGPRALARHSGPIDVLFGMLDAAHRYIDRAVDGLVPVDAEALRN